MVHVMIIDFFFDGPFGNLIQSTLMVLFVSSPWWICVLVLILVDGPFCSPFGKQMHANGNGPFCATYWVLGGTANKRLKRFL